MKNNVAGIRGLMQFTFFVITALVYLNPVRAQVSGYTLTTSVGTFTPINSGSGTNFQTYVIGSSGSDELSVDYSLTPVPVGGTTTDYITVFDNGFIELVPTGFTPAYGSVSNPVSGDLTGPFTIAPFGADLEAAETGSPALKIVTTGSEIIAEWDDVRRKGVSGEKISFQARINITTGEIKFIYGGTIVAGTDTNYPEVGLKGYSNRDFNNISVASTGSWSTPAPGATCRSTAYFNAANSGVAPVAGLTYTFTPTAVPDIIVARRDDNRLGLILNNEGATISDLHTSVSGNNLIITAAGAGNSIALAASVPSGVTTNGTSTITVDLSVMSDFGGFSVFGGINEDTVSIGTGGVDLSATPAGSARQSFTVELIDGPDQYFQNNPVISKNGGYIGIYCSCSYNIGGLTGAGADTLVLFTGGLVTQSAPVKAGVLSVGGFSDGVFSLSQLLAPKPGKINFTPQAIESRVPVLLGYNLNNALNEVDTLTSGQIAGLIFLAEKDSVTLLESVSVTEEQLDTLVNLGMPPTVLSSYTVQAGLDVRIKGAIFGGIINIASQNGGVYTSVLDTALLIGLGNVTLAGFTQVDAAFVFSFGTVNLLSDGDVTVLPTGLIQIPINILSFAGTLIDASGDVKVNDGGMVSYGNVVVQADGLVLIEENGINNTDGTGGITVVSGSTVYVTAAGLRSKGNISVQAVQDINVQDGGIYNATGTGSISISSSGNITISGGGLQSNNDIIVHASNNVIAQNGGISNNNGTGKIEIVAGGTVSVSGGGLQSKGDITVQAAGNISSKDGGTVNTYGSGKVIMSSTGGGITLEGSGIQSNGAISVSASGNIVVTNAGVSNSYGTGSVTILTTGGTITSNQGGITSAGAISASANGDILISDAGMNNAGGTGNIMITSGGGVTTSGSGLQSKGNISLSATGNILVTNGGASNSTGTGNITIVTTGGTFTSNQTGISSAGEISVTALGNIQITDGGANNTAGSGDILVSSAGGVSVGGSGLRSKGDITVQAGGAIITDAGGVINTSGTGNISMTTTGGGITTMSSGLQSKGDISLSATGDVLITNGGASNSSGTGNITVITTGGTFTSNQNGISSAGEISVTASGNILVADAGINSTSATDDVFITSTAGGVTLQAPVSSGSDVILTADIFTNSLMGGSVTGDIVRIKPHNYTNIELGSADATGLLGLSADDLQNINADTIYIGDPALTQDITVASLLSLSGKNLAFKTAQGGKLSLTNSLTAGFIDLSGVSEFSTEVLDNSSAYFIDAVTGAELGTGVSLTIADIPDDLQIGDVISLISSTGQVSGNFSGLNAGDTIRIVDARAATIEFVIDYGSAGRGNPDASRIIPATGVTLTVADVVFESVPPVAVCKDTTVVLDASGSISLSASVLDDGSYDVLSPPVSFLPLNTQFSCSDLGANTVTLTVTDTIGNTATCQSVITVNTATSPAVSITETSSGINNDGIICAGSSATIAVTGSSACLWSDGSTGTSISVSPSCTSIYSVTITDGSSCTSDVDNLIEVSKSPGITSITPVSGTAGTVITINGTDLTGIVSVLFNGTPSATVNEISSGQITATLPQSGSIQQLTVNTNCGMVSIPVASPVITSFSPSAGSIGTPITVTGSNLNNLQTAQVGGTPAVILSRSSSVAVIVPMPGTSTGTIMVSNGTGTTTSSSTFTVNATPYPYFQQGSKLSSTGTNTLQGTSVAVSANGNTAIIGAPGDNSGAGAAYIYVRTGTSWAQQGAKLVGSGAVGSSRQGTSVAISSDGNTVVVGGPNDNSNAGAAWIYTRNGSSWSQQGPKLVGTGAAGAALQGTSVALSGDGTTVVVGGFGDDSFAGAVWVFSRADNYWLQQGNKIVGTGTVGKARQGASVALSSDGNTLIFGGYQDNNRQGAVWVFSRAGCDWTQQGSKLLGSGGSNQAWQGVSVALGADGNYAVIGGSSDNNLVGAAWVFTRSGNTWTQQGSKIAGTAPLGASRQGSSVAISADGKTAVIGGAGDNGGKGAMWMFTRNNTTWSQQGQKLTGSAAAGAAKQATSVALSADGKTALIGGPADASNKGAFWVYIPAAGTLFRPDVRSEMPDMAGEFKLEQNIPNPFKGQTTVPFVLPEPCTVAWEISDASGRVVLSLKRDYPAGENQEVFNLEMYNGAFYYRMTTPHGTKVRKMTALGN